MKKLVFLLVALFSATPIFAQSDDDENSRYVPGQSNDDGELGYIDGFEKEKANAFFLGPKIGGTMNMMSQPDFGQIYDTSGYGFGGGVAMKARFGKATENSPGGSGYWGVALELKYALHSPKTLAADEKGKANASLAINHFEIPVLVQFYPLAKTKAMSSLYVEAGLALDIPMGVNPEYLITPEHSIKTGDLKPFDCRPTIGLGYTFKKGFDINARYYVGVSELAKNFSSKVSTMEISFAWMFKCGKF